MEDKENRSSNPAVMTCLNSAVRCTKHTSILETDIHSFSLSLLFSFYTRVGTTIRPRRLWPFKQSLLLDLEIRGMLGVGLERSYDVRTGLVAELGVDLLGPEEVCAGDAHRLAALALLDVETGGGLVVGLELGEELLAHDVALPALAADLLRPNAVQHVAHHGPREQVDVLAHKDRQRQGPPLAAVQQVAAPRVAVAKDVHDGRRRDAAGPGEELEAFDPGPDRVGTDRVGALRAVADLDKVGPQLEPVVDQESDGDQGPHGREQGQVPKLQYHLEVVCLHVIGLEVGFVARPAQKFRLGRVIRHDGLEVDGLGPRDARRPPVSVPAASLVQDVRQDELLARAGDLASHGEGDDLVTELIRVRVEGRRHVAG